MIARFCHQSHSHAAPRTPEESPCAGGTMCVWKTIGKDVWTAAGRQIAIEPFEVREAAAEDDDLRVEDVDDAGQRPAEARFVALQRRLADRGRRRRRGRRSAAGDRGLRRSGRHGRASAPAR